MNGADVARLLLPRMVENGRLVGAASATDERRTYGGTLAAQTLAAAAATVDDRPCNALHLLFVAAGDAGQEVALDVDRLRDGGSFAQRRIRASQDDRALIAGLASFHAGDDGPSHQVAKPDVPDPETLEDQREVRRRNAEVKGRPLKRFIAEDILDARSVTLPSDRSRGFESRRLLWFRTREAMPDTPLLHQAIIAFASDMGLVHVGVQAHNELGDGHALDAASLDHSICFHRPARADEWLLHVQRSPSAQGGRGIAHGVIFDRDGQLVASVAQEILVRRRRS